MEQNEKPFQYLAWIATSILILAALLASFVPALEYHHWAFIIANSLWVVVGYLWKEMSLIVLNAGLTIIYVLGLVLYCLLYTSPSPRDRQKSRMPSSA